MKKKPPFLIAAVAATMVAAGISATAIAGTSEGNLDTELLQQRVDQLSEKAKAPVIAEVRDGEETWTGAAGNRESGGDEAAEPTDNVRIGSITKTMTTTVVMQLVEDGKLSLDTPIDEVLPNGSPYAEKLTVRHLLGHTSGIPDYLQMIYSSYDALKNNRQKEFKPEELVEMAGTELLFAPGSDWTYSNTNYILLGMIVENIAGSTIEDEISSRVIEKTGMSATYMPDKDLGLESPYLHAYYRRKLGMGEIDTTEFSPTQSRGAGSVVSRPSEVNTFYRALLSGELVSKESLKEMASFSDQSEGQYGLGMLSLQVGEGCEPVPGGVAQGHTGGTYGHKSFSFHSPDGNRQMTFTLGVDPYSIPQLESDAVYTAIDSLQAASLCGTESLPKGFESPDSDLEPELVKD